MKMTSKPFRTLTLFSITFLNIWIKEALDLIESLLKGSSPTPIYIVNADCLNKIFSDKEYLDILHQADYIFADGSGIKLGCKIMGNTVVDNVNGTDLFPLLCERASQRHFTLYLLGAKPGLAAKTQQNMVNRYPGLKIVGTHHGYFKHNSEEEQAVIKAINDSLADILLVAFGVPAQEKWIHTNRHKLSPKVLIGVGGLFDFYSGHIPRAPLWLRKIGLEWIYRFYQEPRRRFKRYFLGNPLFIYRVYHWKWFGLKK